MNSAHLSKIKGSVNIEGVGERGVYFSLTRNQACRIPSGDLTASLLGDIAHFCFKSNYIIPLIMLPYQ